MRRTALALSLTLVLAAVVGARATASYDDFASAGVIGSLPFTVSLDNTGATTESGEPSPCGLVGTSLWFQYAPATDMKVRLDTLAATTIDTVLAVYEGSSVGGLTTVVCNDDHVKSITAGVLQSLLFFEARAGHTYRIQVSGFHSAQGPITLNAAFDAPLPLPCPTCPTYTLNDVPEDLDTRAGEVSLAVDPRTNETLFLMLGHTLKVTWDGNDVPSWSDVSGLLLNTTNDPILEADPDTGRIVIAQLRAAAATAASAIGITDNAGATWQLGEPAALGPSWDHQSIGIGPYPQGVVNPAYPNAMYYCAQAGISFSQCARSDNGGLTWGAPLAMNTLACSGLHGHIAVDASGTVYVPHKSCFDSSGDRQGFVYSKDMGTTWATRFVPGTVPDRSDPKIAFDAAGRLYFAAASAGKPVVMTSDDDGAHWNAAAPTNLGADFGIRNTVFPAVVAGDAGRAAVSFYGSTSAGNDQAADFAGEWHQYVSTTIDGGATWQTVNVTPGDPVQRGCIWLAGGSNACRNLLDFQDMVIDRDGRILVGIADGCVSDRCVDDFDHGDRASHGVIARQATGPLMRAPA